MSTMSELIEALQIFVKYKDKDYPTCCDHEVLVVVDITKDEVSPKDKKRLDELGFFWSKEFDAWASFRFGSG